MTPNERSRSLSVRTLNREPSDALTISAWRSRRREKRRRALAGSRIQSLAAPFLSAFWGRGSRTSTAERLCDRRVTMRIMTGTSNFSDRS